MIPWYKPHFWGDEKRCVVEALESTWISDGGFVQRFEAALGEAIEVPHVTTTSNGTTSLMLAYLALGLGPGDEIIVPGFTFAAPANMAAAVGATPVFADVRADTWLLCPDSVRQKISEKTRAIVPVHIYGNVCDMDSLRSIAEQHRLFLVEDVAEAAFSTYRGEQAGSMGDFGSFSFQATKTITTGEGGAVCTRSAELADRAALFRNHGMRAGKRYWHEVIGHNFRMTNMQAAMGYAQMLHLPEIIDNKRRVFARYQANLRDQQGIHLQGITPGCEPVMWAIAVKLDAQRYDRDQVIAAMAEKGVETRPGFYSFSDMPLYRCEPLAQSTDIGRNTISLPSFTMISDSEIDHVCELFLAELGS